jgi:hypothetical protein
MKRGLKRRDFLNTCFKAGMTCCALTSLTWFTGHDATIKQDVKPDPKSLNYCGYKCSQKCLLLKATTVNNVELKKKAYEDFKLKEKHGIEFDPENVFCFGCKIQDKPISIVVRSCTVRSCVIAKGYECCIQCDGLTKCDKELWISFPEFKKIVIEIQKKYIAGHS